MCFFSGQETAGAGCSVKDGELRLTARQTQGCDFTHKGCSSPSKGAKRAGGGSDDVNQSQPTVRWLSNKPIMMRQVWHQARNSSQSGAGLPATQLWKVQAWKPQLKCSFQAKWEDEASHNSFSYRLFFSLQTNPRPYSCTASKMTLNTGN